ncbi:UNVERIFIED_CONTAM: hypothetical protein RMT77_019547 [Armadillidium vulgare]
MLKLFDHRYFILTSNIDFESELLALKSHSQISSTLTVGKKILGTSDLLRRQWWIFLIAALVGILILALLSVLLYKFGFFERKRLQKAKITKNEEPNEPLFMSESEGAVAGAHHSVGQCVNPVQVQEED